MRSHLRQLTRRRRLAIEGLEQRRVLAATVFNEFQLAPLFGSEDQDRCLEIRGEPNASLQAGTTLTDIENSPVLESLSPTFAQNSPAGTVVGTVAGSDEAAEQSLSDAIIDGTQATSFEMQDLDAGETLPFAIVSQALDSLTVDATPGQLVVAQNPNVDFEGDSQNSLTVRVTDGANPAAKTMATVHDTHVNAPPTLAQPIADKTVEVGEPFSFTIPAGTFMDQDSGDSIRYVMTTAAGSSLPAWLSFDASSRTLSGTPTKENVGALSVKLTALDQLNASSSDVFDIDVEIRPARPWHNRQQIEDVNQDSFVSPVDALMVITYLNSGKSPQVPSGAKAAHGMLDVNGDNFVTPVDALIIINRLNKSGGEGEARQPNMADAVELGLLDEHLEGKRRKSEELLWMLAADRIAKVHPIT